MQVAELARTHNSFEHFVAEQVRTSVSESQPCVGIHVDADFLEIGRDESLHPCRTGVWTRQQCFRVMELLLWTTAAMRYLPAGPLQYRIVAGRLNPDDCLRQDRRAIAHKMAPRRNSQS
jgi:hypothetical protein